jgi:hypothetical protein
VLLSWQLRLLRERPETPLHLHHRNADCLDCKATTSQIEELGRLLAPSWLLSRRPKAKRPYRFKTPDLHWYNGISAAECKGPRLTCKGELPSFHLPWPSDIANFYASVEV